VDGLLNFYLTDRAHPTALLAWDPVLFAWVARRHLA